MGIQKMVVRQLLCVFLSAVLVWRRAAGIEHKANCRFVSFRLGSFKNIVVTNYANRIPVKWYSAHTSSQSPEIPQESPVEIDAKASVASQIDVIPEDVGPSSDLLSSKQKEIMKQNMVQKLIDQWDWSWLQPFRDEPREGCYVVSRPGFTSALASYLHPLIIQQNKPNVHYYDFFGERDTLIQQKLPHAPGLLCIMIDRREDRSVGMLSVYSRSKKAFEEGEDPIFIHLDAIVNGAKVSAKIPNDQWKNLIDKWHVLARLNPPYSKDSPNFITFEEKPEGSLEEEKESSSLEEEKESSSLEEEKESSSLKEGTTSTKPDPLAVLAEYENILNEFGWTRCEEGSCYQATTGGQHFRMIPEPDAAVFVTKFLADGKTEATISLKALRQWPEENSRRSLVRGMKLSRRKKHKMGKRNKKRNRRYKK